MEMIDDVIVWFKRIVEDDADFKGQELASSLQQYICGAFLVLGCIFGFIRQDYFEMAYVIVAGGAIAAVLTVPSWPYLRSHPLTKSSKKAEGPDCPGKAVPASGGQKQPVTTRN
eukprot:GHVO01022307.1.p1 GENE.GHVO01022307.1~~GHVO01022307.1.p1  ORF type:complete len:123 (+),score=14.12 GHVO01022307.1:30-371(+)